MAKTKESVKGLRDAPTTDFTMKLVNDAVIRFNPANVVKITVDAENSTATVTLINEIAGPSKSGTAELA